MHIGAALLPVRQAGRSAAELGLLWAFIARHHAEEALPRSFHDWPMIPTTDGCAHAVSPDKPMLRTYGHENVALVCCLQRLGCIQVHSSMREQHYQQELQLHSGLDAFAPMLSVPSALNALHVAMPQHDSAEAVRRLADAEPAERYGLRSFLSSDPKATEGELPRYPTPRKPCLTCYQLHMLLVLWQPRPAAKSCARCRSSK